MRIVKGKLMKSVVVNITEYRRIENTLKNYRTIFPPDHIERVATNKRIIFIDFHGLRREEAEKLLDRAVVLNRDGVCMCLIHGYRHGTTLKAVIHGYQNPRITQRWVPEENEGITYYLVESVYRKCA